MLGKWVNIRAMISGLPPSAASCNEFHPPLFIRHRSAPLFIKHLTAWTLPLAALYLFHLGSQQKSTESTGPPLIPVLWLKGSPCLNINYYYYYYYYCNYWKIQEKCCLKLYYLNRNLKINVKRKATIMIIIIITEIFSQGKWKHFKISLNPFPGRYSVAQKLTLIHRNRGSTIFMY